MGDRRTWRAVVVTGEAPEPDAVRQSLASLAWCDSRTVVTRSPLSLPEGVQAAPDLAAAVSAWPLAAALPDAVLWVRAGEVLADDGPRLAEALPDGREGASRVWRLPYRVEVQGRVLQHPAIQATHEARLGLREAMDGGVPWDAAAPDAVPVLDSPVRLHGRYGSDLGCWLDDLLRDVRHRQACGRLRDPETCWAEALERLAAGRSRESPHPDALQYAAGAALAWQSLMEAVLGWETASSDLPLDALFALPPMTARETTSGEADEGSLEDLRLALENLRLREVGRARLCAAAEARAAELAEANRTLAAECSDVRAELDRIRATRWWRWRTWLTQWCCRGR